MENLDWLLGWAPVLSAGIILGAVGPWLLNKVWQKLHAHKQPPKRLFTFDLPLQDRLRALSLSFTPDAWTKKCAVCDYDSLYLLRGVDPRIHEGDLGRYCGKCFTCYSGLASDERRQQLHLPRLRGYPLLQVLEILERDAIARGILKGPATEETEKPKNFTATVEGTGSYRSPPQRVRVDPEHKTVHPLLQPEPAEAEAFPSDDRARAAANNATSH
jgi:hypothetical protein